MPHTSKVKKKLSVFSHYRCSSFINEDKGSKIMYICNYIKLTPPMIKCGIILERKTRELLLNIRNLYPQRQSVRRFSCSFLSFLLTTVLNPNLAVDSLKSQCIQPVLFHQGLPQNIQPTGMFTVNSSMLKLLKCSQTHPSPSPLRGVSLPQLPGLLNTRNLFTSTLLMPNSKQTVKLHHKNTVSLHEKF